ncbi:MAG: phosphoglycerate kinase [Nitrospinaceae bacterium]|nr:MAG: phosphoglycerate kinase [Nitrospinaceae bacterium]
MLDSIGMESLDSLNPEDLVGKTIFIRVDFNVPLLTAKRGYYRVADDTRIRRFLDLTFKKIHELTDGECRIIIGSHLGRPHKTKDHVGWDGIFNIQFVSTHFDTLIRKRYGDTYTIFPPEIIDSHLKHSLEILSHHRLPPGGVKFLPNLRYLLEPKNPETYREEFINDIAETSDVYINCAFGCSHRVTRSIKMLPHLMRQKGKIVLAGNLLHEEIRVLGGFGKRALSNPQKTVVIAGGAKIEDKISILKQFVQSRVKRIIIGGKMVNAFLLAKLRKDQVAPLSVDTIPTKLMGKSDEDRQTLINETKLAEEILDLSEKNGVEIVFPEDYKVVADFHDSTYEVKDLPDFNKELQLDLGPKTIENFSKTILTGDIENVFWNGPLGAYDHPSSSSYLEGSLELAKLLFGAALINPKLSVVIGGGDSAAILNRISINELKNLIKKQIEKQLLPPINRNLLTIGFSEDDSYILWNYFSSNFFVSTGGGASLEFLEQFLKNGGKSEWASYLPGTSALMESAPA